MMGGSYQVTLTKPFYCGVFEVTQKQYELVTGSNPSSYSYKGDMRPVESVSWNTIRGNSSSYNWPSSANVDSNSFVGRLQARTGLNFDLPTEAQWEYACRAGTTSKYNNGGDTENDLRELGRYSGNRSNGKGGYTDAHTKVGSYEPNAWGLYDMHGNVREWCLDWHENLSSGVTDPVGSSSGSYRVRRGGGWSHDASRCTSSYRDYYLPSNDTDSFGFRLVRTLSNTEGERSPGAERADTLCAAEAAPVAIDSRDGVKSVLESVVLPWNAEWIGGNANATVVITDNATEVKRTTGAGEFEIVGDGRHELTYTTYIGGVSQDEVYTATVFKGWAYEVDDNGDAILVNTAYKSGDVVIPSEIDGHAVIEIADGIFAGCDDITSATISGNLLSSISELFPDSYDIITSITLTGSITEIPARAFQGCRGLTDLTIPETVTSIGECAFEGCGALTSVTIPDSVASIGEEAFAGCAGLQRVDAPKALRAMIELRNVFKDCADNLEIVYFGPEICEVVAKQRYPWNGMVDITCTVSGISGTANNLEFTVAAVNSGNVHDISQFWVVKNGTNSTDRKVHTNGTYHLVWDSKSDFDNQICSNMVMRVNLAVFHDKVQLWENGPYWATTNIGADNPEDYGYYFWWGDAVGYKRENDKWVASDGSSLDFSFDDYDYNTPTDGKSVSTLQSEGWITTDGVLAPEHDAAHVHWGGDWRMPTIQELSDLNSKCDWTWTTMNGVNGYSVRGRGDYASNSIFLPCAGFGYWTSLYNAGSYGNYWSSVPNSDNYGAWDLGFGSGDHGTYYYGDRRYGQPVRPVQGFTGQGNPTYTEDDSSGDSAPFVLNNATSPSSESVVLPWNAEWIGGDANATVVITDNGTEVKRTTGIGEFTLNSSCGTHQLEYSTFISGVKQGETYTAQVELSHVAVETKAAKAPTCTESGWTHEVICSRCGAIIEESVAVPAEHVRQTTIVAIDPTCTADGRTAEVVCSRCGITLETSEVVPGGHSGAITKPAVEPTSSTAGKTAEIRCSRCGELLQEQTTIPALGYIRNVTARQLWPHKKVEVCYEVAEDIREVLDIGQGLMLVGESGSSVFVARNVIGDMTCAPGLHCVIWDMDADVTSVNSGAMTFTVMDGMCVSGFVTKTFSSSSLKFDKTSDVWSGSPATVATPDKIYAKSLPEHTTVAYGCYMLMAAGVTYEFKGCYDDFVGVKVGTSWIISNTSECKEASGSCTPPSTGFYKVEFRVGNNGGVGGCQNSSEYGMKWRSSANATWRNVANTSSETVFFSSVIGNGEETVSASSPAIAVNTSSSVKDGMSVAGTVNLGHSPFADGEVTVLVDGVAVLSSTNSDVFTWQPRTTGTHTLKHNSGDYEWTRIVNVTSLAFDMPPTPSPPTPADGNIAIGSTSRAFGVGGGSGTITTSGSGTWSASASDDWITIPSAMASRNAGLPVVYQVKANSGVEERMGYIYVSGHVFTITQAGVGAELDAYSADFETEGGTGSFTVLADAQTSWKVRSNVDWISVAVEGTGNGEQGTVGIGEQMVLFTVAPWNEVSTRSGTITVAGCTFAVNQTGRRMKLSGANITSTVSGLTSNYDYLSHVLSITVNALASTAWDIEPDSTWISIVDAGTGYGAGSVALAINENPSWLARSGMVRIGTELLTINQAGRPSNALDFSISPENTTASVKGANALISVMATPDLPWTATSQANWLTIMPSFQNGTGNGNVVYTASPNPTMANRSGIIQIAATTSASLAAKTHRVTQPAATSMVSEDACVFDAAGESHAVEVTVDDIVNWTVSENISWLSVVGSTSRIGPGSVTLVASENLTVNPREANLTIAGHSFHVVQKGRTVEVEYTSRVFGTASDYASIDVHPDGNVQWTAVSSDPSWLTIWGDDGCEYDDYGNVIATGDHTIEYIVSDYVGDGTPRTATISIGDKTVYITQRAYELSINPSAAVVGGNAGAGSVGVPATAGQIWNAIATEPWITVVSGYDSGTGSGTVRYTYTDNDTGEERTGRIIIAGEEYTLTQAARQMVAVNVTTRVVTGNGEQVTGNGGVVSGAGTYDRGASVTLSATANDGYEFVNWTLPNGSTAGGAHLVVTADVNKEIFANFCRIPVYAVNGESVREGTSKTFTAPADVIDDAGTTKLVCLGTSQYAEKGTSFTLVVTEDISFEWDLWQTNYLVTVAQTAGGRVLRDGILAANQWVSAGTIIDLTAIPDSGKSFFRWNLSNPDNPVNPVENDSAPSASLRLCVSYPLNISAVFGTFDDTLATALDAPSLTFTTGGDASWLPVIDMTAQTGYTSACSGALGAEAETWLDTTVEGTGTLSFRWRVDCEEDDGGGATWDRLAVFTNGVEAARIDGKNDWQTVELHINGKTTIRWSFYRDDFDEPGTSYENAAWVDGIIFNKEEL